MEHTARLVDVSSPRGAEAVVLVLHGGASRRDMVHVSPAQLSVLRMVPTARSIARQGGGRLAVFRVLNSYRGWDARHTPVDDVRWALARVEERHPGLPVGLVGHSLGGRAALLSGALPQVESIVALNPWLYPSEQLVRSGARILVVHGLHDRIAPAARSAAYVERLGGDRAAFIGLTEGKHAMLRGGLVFDRYAAEFMAATLLADPPAPSGPVARVLAGEQFVQM